MRSKTAQKVCFPTETVAVTLRVSEGAERSMNASINIIYSWRRELIVITGTSLHFLLYLNLDERIDSNFAMIPSRYGVKMALGQSSLKLTSAAPANDVKIMLSFE